MGKHYFFAIFNKFMRDLLSVCLSVSLLLSRKAMHFRMCGYYTTLIYGTPWWKWNQLVSGV